MQPIGSLLRNHCLWGISHYRRQWKLRWISHVQPGYLTAIVLAAASAAATGSYAQSTHNGTTSMPVQQAPAPQVPPEILQYINGPAAESKQFDFLIGYWNVDAVRYKEDGTPLLQYKATWSAVHLNGGRMIMDDFKALGPTGQPVSSFVTLRTYSQTTNRWELAGLQALQPAMPSDWHGVAKDGEMLLDATTKTPAGETIKIKIRFFDITPNSFSWESAMSLDQGKNWRKTATLTALRAQPK